MTHISVHMLVAHAAIDMYTPYEQLFGSYTI